MPWCTHRLNPPREGFGNCNRDRSSPQILPMSCGTSLATGSDPLFFAAFAPFAPLRHAVALDDAGRKRSQGGVSLDWGRRPVWAKVMTPAQ